MPNVKSAKKRVKTNEKKNLRNRIVRSTLRTALKKVNAAIEAGDAEAAAKSAPLALSLIGRTVKKGVIHRNTAARLESRLAHKLNALQTQSA
jgi:small subunit ribosomal protein S20